MIGEILALLAAICWALSAVLYKGVLRRIDYVTTNLVRIGFAVLFLLSIVLATLHNLPSVPLGALSFLMLAADHKPRDRGYALFYQFEEDWDL